MPFENLVEDVKLRIFQGLRPVDTVRLGMTCRPYRVLGDASLKVKLDACIILRQFFNDHELFEFRDLLRQTGTIISGSSTLLLLDGESLGVIPNLDLYVENEHRWRLRTWLRDRFTWSVLSQEDVQTWAYGGRPMVVKVVRFERSFEGRTRTIHCVVTESNPIEAIFTLKLTCAMNFITHDKAYSLFPKSTFDDHNAYLVDTYTSKNEYYYNSYKNLGWHVLVPPLAKKHSSLPKIRYIGDRECWIIQNVFPSLPALQPSTNAQALPIVDYLHSFRLFYNPIVSLHFCTLYDHSLHHSGTYAFHEKVWTFVDSITKDYGSTKESIQVNMKNFLEYNFNGRLVPMTEEEVEEELEYERTLNKSGRQAIPPVDEEDSGDDAEDNAFSYHCFFL
ncbi:hypothetical protein BDN72DRAFT_904768 [Pluteus cervinus]|uniref:Uncharacterized protein n=1 Tax=Pluteus cervinus TaxID=181527 RepID=A0ACD3A4C6_9AGAR|nr:hypothetical protein BDN72DRAFT_904768 [Pluteus cervinus]